MTWSYESPDTCLGVQILEEFSRVQYPETHRVMIYEEHVVRAKTSVYKKNTPVEKALARRRYAAKLKRDPARNLLVTGHLPRKPRKIPVKQYQANYYQQNKKKVNERRRLWRQGKKK